MKNKTLKDVFGHNSFRELQEEGVDTILNKQDLLMILPTGGGKSLVFQLPSLMKKGITVVISPLIALMQDQVNSLVAQNINAHMINSSLNNEQINEVIQKCINEDVKFLYLSPERLNTQNTLEFLHKLDINFFVIDEAHCISQWGHEFRNDYRTLGNLKQNFPNTSISAFTATSTNTVTNDIISELKMQNAKILKGKIYRKNLFISAHRRISNGHSQLLDFVSKYKNESGIIYVNSRKKTQEISDFLNNNGYKSLFYHAGLSQKIREDNFRLFTNDKVDIMVATIAFGMGIDKSDIRFVAHMSLPKSLENYYQEIGRAGRDGEQSETLLLFNASDVMGHKRNLDEIENEDYKKHMQEKIDKIYKYSTSEICFHKQLAQYFDDDMNICQDRCGNCQDTTSQREDITKKAQMILSTIYKVNQKFGKNYIVDILRGSKEQKILQNKANELSVYAIGKQTSKKEWFIIIERLIEINAITIGEYQSLNLTKYAVDILKNKEKIDIKKSRLNVNIKEKVIKVIKEFDYDEVLFEKLRVKRRELAFKINKPSYIIFSDKTLKYLAKDKPNDKKSMLEINGVGERKYEQYGEYFLAIINE